MTGGRNPEIPNGYSSDYINAEVILNRLSVKNGRFVLPDGMNSPDCDLKTTFDLLVVEKDVETGDATNMAIKPAFRTNFPEAEIVTAIDGPFEVNFVNKEIGPEETVTFAKLTDWSESQRTQELPLTKQNSRLTNYRVVEHSISIWAR